MINSEKNLSEIIVDKILDIQKVTILPKIDYLITKKGVD
jgi:hypothetical protein